MFPSLTSLKGRIILLSSIFGLLILFFLIPLPQELRSSSALPPLRILDRNGTELYAVRNPAGGSQQAIPLSDIPPLFIRGVVAVEDRSFFLHPGISPSGILRAALMNLRARRIVAGGSTITQQLVRGRLQPKTRNYFSKAREALLAIRLEMMLTKNEILEEYLNTAYFGHRAYGIAAAAETYFGKRVQDLSIAETALLIGLLRGPTINDPFTDSELARERRRIVLAVLHSKGLITETQKEDALRESIALHEDRVPIRAPHFVLWLLRERAHALEEKETITTTLDWNLQQEVERIVTRRVAELAEKNVTAAAVVVLDAQNGDILAMQGSADYFDIEHDGAVNVAVSPRQPGSALKPFTYALALFRGMTVASTIPDVAIRYLTAEGNPYTPRNYDYEEHGLVRIREALANSYNIAAVRVLENVGVPSLHAFLRSAGITTLTQPPEHYGVALTLGSGEVKLLELASAYGIFARAGKTLTPRILADDPSTEGSQILDPSVAWLIADILSDGEARLPAFGESRSLSFSYPVAAKTGTTRNARDNWLIGFTLDRIVGVWVGNADNSPMRDTSGITGAGPIFHDVMEAAMKGIDPSWLPQPTNITNQTICTLSGLLPTPACPHTMREVFLRGTEPTERDDIYTSVNIDMRNGLRAGPSCDPRFVREEVFTVFPPEVRAWARENDWKEPPDSFSPLCGNSDAFIIPHTDEPFVTITSPQNLDSFLLDPLIPDDDELLILEARASNGIQTITWSVDGVIIGTGKKPDFRVTWKPEAGAHVIRAMAGETKDNVWITVEN